MSYEVKSDPDHQDIIDSRKQNDKISTSHINRGYVLATALVLGIGSI